MLAAQTSQQKQVLQTPSAGILPLCRSSLIEFTDASQFLTCESRKNILNYIYLLGIVHIVVHVWMSEDSLRKLILICYLAGPGD